MKRTDNHEMLVGVGSCFFIVSHTPSWVPGLNPWMSQVPFWMEFACSVSVWVFSSYSCLLPPLTLFHQWHITTLTVPCDFRWHHRTIESEFLNRGYVFSDFYLPHREELDSSVPQMRRSEPLLQATEGQLLPQTPMQRWGLNGWWHIHSASSCIFSCGLSCWLFLFLFLPSAAGSGGTLLKAAGL